MLVNVRQGSIHCEIVGEGRPILVLHAMGTDHRAMSSWMEPIFTRMTGWKRIYADIPAHGKSVIDGSAKGTEDFANMLLEFIDQVLPNGSFSIVGMSYGGFLAQGIIHHLQDRIDGICLIAPNVQLSQGERELPPRAVRERDESLLSGMDPDIRTAFETLFVYQNEGNFRSFMEYIQPGRQLADRKFLSSGWRERHYFFPYEPLGHLEKLEQPALIVLGRLDSICGYGDQVRMLDKFDGATLAILDRCGHMIPIEGKHLLERLVAEWLERVCAAS